MVPPVVIMDDSNVTVSESSDVSDNEAPLDDHVGAPQDSSVDEVQEIDGSISDASSDESLALPRLFDDEEADAKVDG